MIDGFLSIKVVEEVSSLEMEISSKRVEDQVSRQSDLARVGSRVSQVVRVSDRTTRRGLTIAVQGSCRSNRSQGLGWMSLEAEDPCRYAAGPVGYGYGCSKVVPLFRIAEVD